jgi:hypothetical protein
MIKSDTNQLVIIELVIGMPPMLKNCSALRCTPSPAAKTCMEEKRKAITGANDFKVKSVSNKLSIKIGQTTSILLM